MFPSPVLSFPGDARAGSRERTLHAEGPSVPRRHARRLASAFLEISTRAENFHGAEARAGDGGRGGGALVAGCQASCRLVPGFLKLPFWAPSSPAEKTVTLCVPPPTTTTTTTHHTVLEHDRVWCADPRLVRPLQGACQAVIAEVLRCLHLVWGHCSSDSGSEC